MLFYYVDFLHRTAHGMATCQPTSTWTPTSISSCPVFFSKLGKDASSSPVLTLTFAQCKSNMATWMSALTHWREVWNESICTNSIATLHECFVNELGIHFVSREVPDDSLIFVPVLLLGCVTSRTNIPSSSWPREFLKRIPCWWTSAARPLKSL